VPCVFIRLYPDLLQTLQLTLRQFDEGCREPKGADSILCEEFGRKFLCQREAFDYMTFAIAEKTVWSRNHEEEIREGPRHAKFVAIMVFHQLPWSCHALKFSRQFYVFSAGNFCTPARSLNTPWFLITRVIQGTDCGTFVMIVGALPTWAIDTQ